MNRPSVPFALLAATVAGLACSNAFACNEVAPSMGNAILDARTATISMNPLYMHRNNQRQRRKRARQRR